MSDENIEKTFECGEHASLSLSNVRGKVSIQTGDNAVIVVHASKNPKSGDAENTDIEMLQDSEGRIVVRTRYDKPGFGFFRRMTPCKVDYQVYVPENCDLKIRGVSNSTEIDGVSGVVDVSTVSGDLELRSLNGNLKIKTVSGDVQGENVSAGARLESVSGDIRLKNSSFPNLRGKTVSGDLVLETPFGEGPYDFNAVSGDIKLIVNPLSGATVSSSSLSGEIRTAIPVSWSNTSRNHRKVEIKGGGVEIHHNSVSGDFFLDSTDNGEIPGELTPTKTGEVMPSSTEILDSIERGELSVDEAVGILEKNNGSE